MANAIVRRGAALGLAFGGWNLLVTWVDPLLDDTPARRLPPLLCAGRGSWRIAIPEDNER